MFIGCLPGHQRTSAGLFDFAGDKLLHLYSHYKGSALPLLATPPLPCSQQLVILFVEQQHWESAIAAAEDISSAEPQAAAKAVLMVLAALQRHCHVRCT